MRHVVIGWLGLTGGCAVGDRDCEGGLGETFDVADADVRLDGAPETGLGRLAAVGDVDHDGTDDLVVADEDGWTWVVQQPPCGRSEIAGMPRIGDDAEHLNEVEVVAVGPDGTLAIAHWTGGGQMSVELFVAPIVGEMPYSAAAASISPPDGLWIGHDGHGLALPGDVTGDGIADVALGGSGADGVYLLAGPFAGHVDGAAAVTLHIIGSPQDTLGFETPADVVGGDVTGDGLADLLVPAISGYGVAVFEGPIEGGTVTHGEADIALGPIAGAEASTSYAKPPTVGDLDGDGIDDIVMRTVWTNGASGDDHETWGGAVVWSASTGAPIVDIQDAEEDRGGVFVHGLDSLVAADDVDGDGADDLIASYIVRSEDDPTSGFVYYGPLSGSLEAFDAGTTIFDYEAMGGFENGVTKGDFNGDGLSDLVFGDPYARDGRGAVHLLFGG